MSHQLKLLKYYFKLAAGIKWLKKLSIQYEAASDN